MPPLIRSTDNATLHPRPRPPSPTQTYVMLGASGLLLTISAIAILRMPTSGFLCYSVPYSDAAACLGKAQNQFPTAYPHAVTYGNLLPAATSMTFLRYCVMHLTCMGGLGPGPQALPSHPCTAAVLGRDP